MQFKNWIREHILFNFANRSLNIFAVNHENSICVHQNIAEHAEFDWFMNLAEGDRQRKTTFCPNAVANTDSFITIL